VLDAPTIEQLAPNSNSELNDEASRDLYARRGVAVAAGRSTLNRCINRSFIL